MNNQNSKPENKRLENIEAIKEKIKKGFKGFLVFAKKHKAVTSIVVAAIVLIVAVFGTINHFLGKINIIDDSKSLAIITLSTGEKIDVSKLIKNPDGTYSLPDGRRFDTDGTVWNLDGSIVYYDGSYLKFDGTAVLSDGTTIYPDGNVVFQDGFYLHNTGIKVDKNAYAKFKTGEKAHITTFTINKDGTINPKKSNLSSIKYAANGSIKIDLSSLDEDAAIIEMSRDKLAQGDKEILANANDRKVWYNDNIINILVMGIDEGNKTYPFGRSDSMVVFSINKISKKIKMISLSRAAYVAIIGYDNTRLNHAHGLGGAPLAIDTVERNYKIRIDNYVSANFDTFKQLIDTIGGVKIKLTSAEASALKNKIKANSLAYNGAGTYNLNGNLALEYVRLRKIDTDKARTQRQRNVLMAIINKAKGMGIFQMTTTLNRILPLITTDLSKSEILSQLVNVQSYLDSSIEQYVIPYKPTLLTLVGDFEVLLLNWDSEIKYLHNLIYGDVTPSYYEK